MNVARVVERKKRIQFHLNTKRKHQKLHVMENTNKILVMEIFFRKKNIQEM